MNKLEICKKIGGVERSKRKKNAMDRYESIQDKYANRIDLRTSRTERRRLKKNARMAEKIKQRA